MSGTQSLLWNELIEVPNGLPWWAGYLGSPACSVAKDAWHFSPIV